MSLIEQAAERLEQLKRAGVEVDERAPVPSPVAAPPEAVLRAIEDGSDEHASSLLTHTPRFERPTHRPSVVMDGNGAGHPGRRLDIDLVRLKQEGLLTPDAPQSQIADEFRIIKRPIIRNALGRDGVKARNGNLIMVTSALPGEGKTFTAINLAMSMAMEFDSTVLLIDGDVAHPSLPNVLGVSNAPGLLDLLTGRDIDVADALVRTNVEKLSILPAGSRHRRSTELLASEQMANLLRELASRYSDRIIIFDSPPLLATTEARVLATHMGQIIMVVAADSTSQNVVNSALATIDSCEIVLMLLNKAHQSDVGTYYGYYANAPSAV